MKQHEIWVFLAIDLRAPALSRAFHTPESCSKYVLSTITEGIVDDGSEPFVEALETWNGLECEVYDLAKEPVFLLVSKLVHFQTT